MLTRKIEKTMTTPLTFRRTVAGLLGLAVLGGGAWLAGHHPARPAASPRLVYTASGYGGFRPALPVPKAATSAVPVSARPQPPAKTLPPAQVAAEAYAAGRYAEAETAAAQVIRQAAQSPTLPHRQEAARAGSLLAYAAARRHDLTLARARFAAARTQAAALPDKGRPPARIGEDPATLEEDDAFQHAVCTGALGDHSAAEAEYVAFMGRYPESPLVQASVKRIARLHGGTLPPAIEAVWKQAMRTGQERQAGRQREASLCGPECLAELLRRQGRAADAPGKLVPRDPVGQDLVHTLAREMGTSARGTTLAALAAAAGRHGLSAQGLSLTQTGLARTLAAPRTSAVALVSPGHYVLVEAAGPGGVTIWDPDGDGQGRGARRTLGLAAWQGLWQGTTLALTPVAARPGPLASKGAAPVQTAHR